VRRLPVACPATTAAALGRRRYRASAEALNFCVDLVRQQDRERYTCNMFAPTDARAALFALHAFNLETAKVRTSTADQNIGRMRIAWWRQTLSQALEGNPPDHPVAQALAQAHARHGLTARFLEQLLDAREADLGVLQPETREDVLMYCERTAGALLLLAVECVQASPPSDKAELAAVHVGTALGLATLLRGASVHAQQRCTYIPVDVAERHGVRIKQVLELKPSAELADAAAELAYEADAHLLAARSLRSQLPTEVRAVLLPAVVADLILQQLQRHAYALFSPEAAAPFGLRLPVRLMWSGFAGTY